MLASDQFTADLRLRGFRMTPQRLAVLQILHDAPGHLSPLEVHEQAVITIPGITEATIYRTLDFLAENNLALAAHVGSGKLVYELARHHHHHVICRECQHAIEIGHAQLESLYREIEAETGFQLNTSHITFFGLCPGCQQKE